MFARLWQQNNNEVSGMYLIACPPSTTPERRYLGGGKFFHSEQNYKNPFLRDETKCYWFSAWNTHTVVCLK